MQCHLESWWSCNPHYREGIVRDVKIKNKSPVSWSCFPSGTWRLLSACSLTQIEETANDGDKCGWMFCHFLWCVVNKCNTRLKHYLFSWTPSRKSVKFDRRLKYLAVPEPEQEATRSHVISARLSENSTSHVTHGKGFIRRGGCIVAQLQRYEKILG